MRNDIPNDAIRSSRRNFLRHAAAAPAAIALGAALALEARAEMALPPATEAVTPFKVDVPESSISDLRARLARTRFPDKETVADWSQGVPLIKARELVEYWASGYDWRRFERKINALPQFRTNIDGLGIHFLHVRSKHASALPMVMTHGWPGSFIEFLKVIDPLTNPTAHGGRAEDAFHLVIPSQPGYGFSDKPSETGWNIPRTAGAWATLMQRLGYDRWVAQGGDWGAAVTHFLANQRPQGLVAAHVNWQFVHDNMPRTNPTPVEKTALDAIAAFKGDGSGYFHLEGTRPQTVAYALADSPVGQAMWIYEKFHAWTDNRGNPEDALTLDEMLDDISLYWFTNTAASSGRTYWENAPTGPDFNFGRIELPMAATVFPREIWRAPRSWAKQMWPNLFYWNEVEHGGHFAAFEQPALFTDELRKAFRIIR
ncbi:epoxide hydrolase [Devosia sp. 1635]|uniref:epoxide hydrolase family protein n=1 Tax=Devosia sp. 1635 TaxID=2726066 RepID=UPI001564D6F0|nr:epoxide hydrolase [Devosia sp. 1635]